MKEGMIDQGGGGGEVGVVGDDVAGQGRSWAGALQLYVGRVAAYPKYAPK